MSVTDINKNRKYKELIDNKIEEAKIKDENIIILGDSNAHLGYLGPQVENNNGKIINNWIEESLILLNTDPNCKGEITWRRNEQISAIDHVLCNNKLYNRFVKMEIDERQEKFDLSDHNLIEITGISTVARPSLNVNIRQLYCKHHNSRNCA